MCEISDELITIACGVAQFIKQALNAFVRAHVHSSPISISLSRACVEIEIKINFRCH